jgi:uncharacterized protein YoaH (UPF0181 family)
VPWKGAQQKAIAAQKMREAKRKGLSDAEARQYVAAFFRKHGHDGKVKRTR